MGQKDDREARMMGHKCAPRYAPVALESARSAGIRVPRSDPKWRATVDEDGHYSFALAL